MMKLDKMPDMLPPMLRDLYGTFTLSAADRAVFRGPGGKMAQFRQAPANAVIEPRPCG